MRWSELDHEVIRQLIAAAEGRDAGKISAADLLAGASVRGLVWHDPQAGEHYATAAGIVLLAKDPSAVFPQCRILADAYRGAEPDGNPHERYAQTLLSLISPQRFVRWVKLDDGKQPTDLSAEQLKTCFTT